MGDGVALGVGLGVALGVSVDGGVMVDGGGVTARVGMDASPKATLPGDISWGTGDTQAEASRTNSSAPQKGRNVAFTALTRTAWM